MENDEELDDAQREKVATAWERGELASLNVGGGKSMKGSELPARLDMVYVLDHGVGDAYRDDL